MFSASLRATLIASCVVVASATRELTVAVTGPEVVNGVQNLQVTASVKNTGDETLKILKDVRGPLSTLETNAFDIVSESGAAPAFNGFIAKYLPEQVIAADLESDFVVLAPGESADVLHDLSRAYNFTMSAEGAYTINVRPDIPFTIVEEAGSAAELTAKTESYAARVSGTLAVARQSGHLSKRASFVGCSSMQQSQINAAVPAAQNYASSTLAYLKGISSGTARYTTWFGTYDASRKALVQSHFNAIAGQTFSTFTYDCTSTDSCYAFVDPADYTRIYFCQAFWRAPNTGTDSRAGTIIHEASHFTRNGAVEDVTYGQSSCRALAQSNPARAVMNADSHEYFAENTPTQS